MEIITATRMLPLTGDCPIIKDGAITVDMGKIHDVGTVDELKSRYPDAELKSYPSCVLMPGLVNAHCHLDLVEFFDAVRPFDTDAPLYTTDFVDMLLSSIDYKHDAKPDAVMNGVRRGTDRLIETGVTCLGDMTHFEGTFKILRETGLRAVVFPEILAGRGEAAQQKFEIALALTEKYNDATHSRVRVGLGPYAPYLLSRNLLKIISQHAKDASIPLMIHAAESFAEMEFFFDSQGQIATEVFPSLGWIDLPPAFRKTPVEYLADIGFFDAPTTIIGGMHLSGKDFPILSRHLVRVVWCPSSSKLMKLGQFPRAKFVESRIPIGLGTDVWHVRNGFNMWDEMRIATVEGSTAPPSGKEAIQMATMGSAITLGIEHLVGSLEIGKRADYIIVSAEWADEEPEDESLYNKLVDATEPQHIRQVVVNGNILKSI